MSKLTGNQKIEIYNKRKNGELFSSLSKTYGVHVSIIKYLVRLIDYHGIEILRVDKNRYYFPELKTEIVNCVLIHNQSITQTSVEYGLLNKYLLVNWIKNFKEMDYNIVERTRGKPTMKKAKPTQSNDKDILLKQQEQEIIYLKAQVKYLKKLHAVIQAKEKQTQKKKKGLSMNYRKIFSYPSY